ncbi:winged helix-turn-helix transcriptional regulator [archaeon]|nr:winged helix-turn-helix transcriptional regulator [archaeon]
MAKKRTKTEITKDILEIIKKKKQISITPLIYKSNLSNNSIKKYLTELIEKELVEEKISKTKKTYELTTKGIKFLEDYEQIRIFADSYGLNI